MTDLDSAAEQRRAKRREAQRRALGWLRDGVTPEVAAKRLREDGLTAKAATRAVERADDRLQRELRGEVAPACIQCGARLASDAAFCDACGTKVPSATDKHFHDTQIAPQLLKGRKWLGAMSIFYALGATLFGVIQESMLIFAINMALSAIQAGLWWWSKKSLLPAAVTSLVLFLTIHLLDAIADPTSLFRGLILKILFVAALIQAIRAALEARSLLRPSEAA